MATRLLRPRLVREAGWDEKIEFRVWRTPAVLFLTSLRDEKINFAECHNPTPGKHYKNKFA
jgi:hypothetical protein